MTIYEEKGYGNRSQYLESLSDDYDVDLDIVLDIAELLGETEDFDGLINSLEDAHKYLGGGLNEN